MKKISIWQLVPLACLVFAQCRTAQPVSTPSARITSEGFITCFEPNLAEGKTWCEASAVLAQGDSLYLANDKDMPAPRSSVFSVISPLQSESGTVQPEPVYLEQRVLRMAHKFEEFAQSPNRNWIFLTTAFDRIKSGSTEFDGYNMLLAWHPGQEGEVQVVGARPGDSTSLGLRQQVQQVLGGSPYFKIEGLAATDTDLWFGIREQGERYDKFDYRITLLKAPYRTEKTATGTKQIVLGALELVRNFEVGDVDPALPKPLAISSIEYDPARRCFWILTSFEQADKIGAYLWVIPEKAMQSNGNLQLIRSPDGKPLTFTHKAEDMTFTDPHTLFIIHDDDRVRTTVGPQERQPNQAAYSVVRIDQ
jgi:hypothetical protein